MHQSVNDNTTSLAPTWKASTSIAMNFTAKETHLF